MLPRIYVEAPTFRYTGTWDSTVVCDGCGVRLDVYVHEGEQWRGADETFAHELVCNGPVRIIPTE